MNFNRLLWGITNALLSTAYLTMIMLSACENDVPPKPISHKIKILPAYQLFNAAQLEFRSLIRQIDDKDEQRRFSDKWDMEKLSTVRKALRKHIGIASEFEVKVYPAGHHRVEIVQEKLIFGNNIRYRELKFDLHGHQFVVYNLTPVTNKKVTGKLPVVIFLMGQQNFQRSIVMIPGVDFYKEIKTWITDDINGTLIASIAKEKLADCYIPSFIADSKMRVALNRLLLISGSCLAAKEFQKCSAVLDYALKQPCVAKEKVVVVGVSMGAQNGLIFSALDTRVKALILNCWAPDLSDGGTLGYFSEARAEDKDQPFGLYLPGLLKFGDCNLLYRLLAPRPVLIISGKRDPLYSPASNYRLYRKLLSFYRKLKLSEHLVGFKISELWHTVDTKCNLPWLRLFFEQGSQMELPMYYRDNLDQYQKETVVYLLDHLKESQFLGNVYMTKTSVVRNGESIPSIFLHPPSQISWIVDLAIEKQRRCLLQCEFGIAETAHDLSTDGVEFIVSIKNIKKNTEQTIFKRIVDPKHNPHDRVYHKLTVDLTRYRGQKFELKMVSNCRREMTSDHFYILNPRLEIK